MATKPVYRKPTIHVDDETGEIIDPTKDIAVLKFQKDEYIHHEDWVERQTIKIYKLYGRQTKLFE